MLVGIDVAKAELRGSSRVDSVAVRRLYVT